MINIYKKKKEFRMFEWARTKPFKNDFTRNLTARKVLDDFSIKFFRMARIFKDFVEKFQIYQNLTSYIKDCNP